MSTFGSVFELSWLSGPDGFQISGANAWALSGRSVASAGDINGDGYDDLWGATGGDPNNGPGRLAYVVFGSDHAFDASFDVSNLDGGYGFQILPQNFFCLSPRRAM